MFLIAFPRGYTRIYFDLIYSYTFINPTPNIGDEANKKQYYFSDKLALLTQHTQWPAAIYRVEIDGPIELGWQIQIVSRRH